MFSTHRVEVKGFESAHLLLRITNSQPPPLLSHHRQALPCHYRSWHHSRMSLFPKISLQKHSWVFRKCFTHCLLAMILTAFNRSEKVLGGRNLPLRISNVKTFMKDVIIRKWMNAFVSHCEVSEWLLFLPLLSPWRNWVLIFVMPDWGY